jgi:hypothetical protein
MSELMNGGKKVKKPKVVKSKKTKKPKSKTSKKENPWLTHVKKTMKENPNKKFKDVLKLAKKTYVKK